MSQLNIRPAESATDWARCFHVLRELRPHLEMGTFVATIRRLQPGGYHLVLAEADTEVVAVGGYRFSEHLARGTFMYVDDLVTLASGRRQGHGAKLLDWLAEKARSSGCTELHLDSGVQRTEAHAFYEQRGMHFSSRHYSLKLT